MENRNFKLDTEWNMLHYSEKPNGFGILIIGDERHFVEEQKSFWMQNEGKQLLLKQLREHGYTCFYSNLYGRHWGTKKASWLAERLYHHIMRTEILNSKIHIIAEGMGALVALDLLNTLENEIRSIVFLNPVFSLTCQLEQEKEHKFFYKKMIKEIALAYGWETSNIAEQIAKMEQEEKGTPEVPIKMIHILSGKRSYQQFEFSKKIAAQWENNNGVIESSVVLPEKKQHLGTVITRFFHQFEKEL